MEAENAAKTHGTNRRLGPAQALLWERWRTGGWLALAACAAPWAGVVILLKGGESAADILSIITFLAFVALTIVLLVRRSGRELTTGVPSYQLRLPVNTARLALINYGYGLFWVGLFVAPLALTTLIAEAVPSATQRNAYLLLHAVCVIVFVWMHVLAWTPAVRKTGFLFAFGLLLVTIPLILVSKSVVGIITFAHLREWYGPYLWCAAAVGFAVAGYFFSWLMLAAERRGAAQTGAELVVPHPRGAVRRRKPFASPFRAQVWFEFRRYCPAVGPFALFSGLVMTVCMVIQLGLLRPVTALSSVFAANATQTLAVILLPAGAWTIGMLILSENHLAGTRHRTFLFTRPQETRLMASARLLALFQVAVIVLGIALATEAVNQSALYAGQRMVNARIARLRLEAGLTPDEPLPEVVGLAQPQKEADYMGSQVVRISDPAWFLGASLFTVLVWSCLTSPVPAVVAAWGPSLLAEFNGSRSASMYTFAALFAGIFAVSACACLWRRLMRWRSLALCVTVFIAALVFPPTDLVDDLPLATSRLFAALLLIVPLLPFTLIPWWLHCQRHR